MTEHYPKQPGQDADAHRQLAERHLEALLKLERLEPAKDYAPPELDTHPLPDYIRRESKP